MRRAQSSTFGTIFSLVLMAVTLVVIFLIFFPNLISGGKQFTECGGYCSYKCDEITTGYRVQTGDTWCEKGVWDLSSYDEDSYYAKTIEKKGLNSTEVVGDSMGLRCCGVLPKKDPRSYFLTKDLRDEVEADDDGRRRDVSNPPRITAYFGDDALPVSMGSMQDVYSNTEFSVQFDITNAECGASSVCSVQLNDDEEEIKDCVVKLIDSDNLDLLTLDSREQVLDRNSVSALKKLCAFDGTPETLMMPAAYEGESLELQILLTKQGTKRYNPNNPTDTKFLMRFRVDNPIRISGLTPAYTREKTVFAQCQGVTCTNYYYRVRYFAQCESPQSKKDIEKLEDIEVMDFASEGSDKAFVIIDKGSFDDDVHFCAYVVTKTGKVVTKQSQVPIHIDQERPSADAKFHAFPDMYTTVTCTDVGGAGCTTSVGYHYISRPVDFVGALFSGFKDPKKCPSDRSAYNFVRVDQETGDGIIPFYSSHDFMVLCIMVEDNAGNNNRDIILTYNSWEILEAIAGNQLGQGGIGSGYTGYNFWS